MLYTLYTPQCTHYTQKAYEIYLRRAKQIQVFWVDDCLQQPTLQTTPEIFKPKASIHAETYGYLLSTALYTFSHPASKASNPSIHSFIQPTTKEYEYKNKRKQKHENLIKQL